MSKGIFITATGTDVGKTFVTALLAKKLRENGFKTGYYKAALSDAQKVDGELIAGDAKYVCDISGLKYKVDTKISYTYQTPVAPHLAAELEGNPIDLAVVKKDFEAFQMLYDYVLVEGSGGIICPLRMDVGCTLMLEDVVKTLDLSVIIVAPSGLGTINATMLTVEYLRAKKIPIQGIVLNQYDENHFLHVDNKKQIRLLSGLPIIACVQTDDEDLNISTETLTTIFKEVLS